MFRLMIAFSVIALSSPVSAEMRYLVNLTIDDGWVNGHIDTDGTLGPLVESNIVGWFLTLNNGIESSNIGPANSIVAFVGPVDSFATEEALYFNFDAEPANIAFDQNGFPGWHFGIHSSNIHIATFAVGPPFDFAESIETGVVMYAYSPAADSDGDGIIDSQDNCVLSFNQQQRDTDSDGFGNRCDPDFNNDGVVNFVDISAWVPFFLTLNGGDADLNGDGNVNYIDYTILLLYFLQAPGPSGLVP